MVFVFAGKYYFLFKEDKASFPFYQKKKKLWSVITYYHAAKNDTKINA